MKFKHIRTVAHNAGPIFNVILKEIYEEREP